MTDKIIIHNYTDLSDYDVLLHVVGVVKEGKVSKTSQGEQYCFVVDFKQCYICSSRKGNTYTFRVMKK